MSQVQSQVTHKHTDFAMSSSHGRPKELWKTDYLTLQNEKKVWNETKNALKPSANVRNFPCHDLRMVDREVIY